MNITDFLLARIDEDEAAAQTAGAWLCEPDAYGEDTLWENAEGLFPQPLLRRSNVDHHFDHIARQSPARVLRECAAKRLFVEDFRGWSPWAMSVLALPYADHPDYDPSWAL